MPRIDLLNKRFGRLVVVEFVGQGPSNHARWKCLCDCGNLTVVDSGNLRWRQTRSCGCLSRGRQIINLTGKRFGRFVVVGLAGQGSDGRARWKCLCDCGTLTEVYSHALRSGGTSSCGCIKQFLPPHGKKHGHSSRGHTTPTYRTWDHMKQRCQNPKHERFKDWGGRGIAVCERWLKFENFLADMGERPEGMTIERMDNDKGYEPGNCKWATSAEQSANKRPLSPRTKAKKSVQKVIPFSITAAAS